MTIAPDTVWQDLTMSVEEILRPMGRWLLVLVAATLVPHVLLWGFPAFPSASTLLATVLLYGFGAALFYGLSAVAHELLHAVAMTIWGGVRWEEMRFGVRWREGIAYIHTAVPMTVRAYRRVLALPGLLQGALPAALGLLFGWPWATLYGFVMLASALGDYAMLRRLRGHAPDALVRDHPTRVGCQILLPDDASPIFGH